ncbi:LarC family nickel insertion protein [Oceanobacillus rekensis]|uniref:LarC family nickel insertion protein n=1 Tax=Oceanobacillus rekensis TaxID=937927 RepID=UPI000B439F9B|nr:LarC family nickel insertion protein [Oceanobacillus rekensis]
MKILYFDCFSGISGDMTIASLIDAGGDANYMAEELKKLGMDSEYDLKWDKVNKNGITSTKFDVILLNDSHEHGDHSHDHEHHQHSHEHTHEHGNHSHDHGHHQHSHEHTHEHGDHSHNNGHHHRSYKDIVDLIKSADLEEQVQDTALKIFKKIGEAEGRIHGMPLEEVYFHEVGAVDSIVDIVGTAILIHQLEIDQVKSAPVPVGGGKIHIDHGVYPVPAPATLEILRGIPIAESDLKAELTTPTGAAIIAVLAEEFGGMPSFKVNTIGYGAGTKTFADHPNVLRTIIGQ